MMAVMSTLSNSSPCDRVGKFNSGGGFVSLISKNTFKEK